MIVKFQKSTHIIYSFLLKKYLKIIIDIYVMALYKNYLYLSNTPKNTIYYLEFNFFLSV